DLPQLICHNMKIVDEPFGGGGDRAFLAHRLGDVAISGEQDAPVLLEARKQQAPAPFPGKGLVLLRESLGELLETLGRVELSPDRRGGARPPGGGGGPRGAFRPPPPPLPPRGSACATPRAL